MNCDKQLKNEDMMQLYKLYLFALRERQLYGDQYGDTDEIIKSYEEKVKDKPMSRLLIKALSGKNNVDKK